VIGCVVLLTLALGLVTVPGAGDAQPAGKVYRVGLLGNSTATLEANLVGPFREGLRDLGWIEGQNLAIEYRWAEGKYERFPSVATGLVADLGRPGGNMNGLSSIAPDLEGKRLELLREVNPRLSHVAVLWNPANAFHVGSLKETRAAAQALGIKVLALSGADRRAVHRRLRGHRARTARWARRATYMDKILRGRPGR
jgi:ABC transporter substrate binding protein